MRIALCTLTLATAIGSGCSSQAPADAPKAETTPPLLVVAIPDTTPVKPVEAPAPKPFAFTADLAGKQVANVSVPTAPASPVIPKVSAPQSRTSSADRGELTLTKPLVTVATLPPLVRKPNLPTPPNEGVPRTLGNAATVDLSHIRMPESPLIRGAVRPEPSGSDVPRLAQQVAERAAIDDPTAEISTERIIQTMLTAPALTAPFLKLLLPDPFEFREHVREKPIAELAATPVIVPPKRP